LVAPFVFLITLGTDRIGNTVHSRMLPISAGMCLCNPATGCVTPFMIWLPQLRALFRDRYPATGFHATMLMNDEAA
jgi:hypothetical protein